MQRFHHCRRTFSGILLLTWLLVAAAAPVLSAAADTRDDKRPEPVDINRADVQELQTLPGIGEAMAQRIIDFRKEHGPFERVEDLLKIKGIGEKSFQKMRPYVTVSKKK